MADKIHRGDAIISAQVWRATPGVVEVGGEFRLTINGKLGVTYTATADTVADVTAGLTAAWNASIIAEFTEITAADVGGTHVTLTADSAGTPFVVTASTFAPSAGKVTVVETTKGIEAVDEVQKLELLGTYTGGTFTVTWNPGGGDETSSAINHNATAADVKTAIVAGMASVTAADIFVTGGSGPSNPWFVQFTGAFAATNVAKMEIDGTNLTGDATIAIDEVTPGGSLSDEIQMISLVNVIGGNYTLTLDGQTTNQIAFNGTSASVLAALEGLPNISVGDVELFGGPLGLQFSGGHIIFVKFTANLAGQNVSRLEIDQTQLSGLGGVSNVSAGGQSSVDEFQFIDLGGATGGAYTLTHDQETTPSLAWDATRAQIGTEIESLPAGNTVSVYGAETVLTTQGNGIYAVKFHGGANVSLMGMSTASLTAATSPGISIIREGGGNIDEVQSIKISATGGSFTLTFDGQTTASIAHGVSAAALKTALELLSTITTVTVTGTGTVADPYLVTFTDPGNQNVALMTFNAASLTGGGGEATTVTTFVAAVDEVQTITIGAGVTSGDFTAAFDGSSPSSAIAFDASAATLETRLESLTTVDDITTSGSAGGWTVTFDSATLGGQDVSLLVVDGTNLVGGSGTETLTITEDTRSGGPNHFDSARNYSDNRVLDSGDTLYLEDGDVGILYGLRMLTEFTVDTGSDVVTFTRDQVAFVDDQILRVKSDDTLPSGFSANTDYYVIALDHHAGTCQLSLSSGGAAVNISDTGTGTHKIALELEGVKHIMRFTGDGGLPKRNTDDYYEYRPDYLEVGIRPGGAKEVVLGIGEGSGSSLLKLDTGDYQTEFKIHDSGSSRETGLSSIRLKNTNDATNILMLDGEVGLAIHAGETSDINKITQRGGILEGGNETGTVSVNEIDKTSGSVRLRNVSINGNLSA